MPRANGEFEHSLPIHSEEDTRGVPSAVRRGEGEDCMITKQPKYVFVTGGVVSSIGKGLAAASMGALMEARGHREDGDSRARRDGRRLGVEVPAEWVARQRDCRTDGVSLHRGQLRSHEPVLQLGHDDRVCSGQGGSSSWPMSDQAIRWW